MSRERLITHEMKAHALKLFNEGASVTDINREALHVGSLRAVALLRCWVGNAAFQERWVRNTRRNRDDERIAKQGYWAVHALSWWEGSCPGGRAMEHQVVYCEANGLTRVPDGYCIHHIDHDKLNNKLSNLELLTRVEHKRKHEAYDKRLMTKPTAGFKWLEAK